jgi:hypothetical protein
LSGFTRPREDGTADAPTGALSVVDTDDRVFEECQHESGQQAAAASH